MAKLPPLDSNKNVIPHDHEEILDDDFVIRKISDELIIIDKNTENKRISSMAYKSTSGALSIDIKRFIEEDNLDPIKHTTTPRWFCSVLLSVSKIRALEFKVGYEPTESNLYHGEIWGKFTGSKTKKLKKMAEWFVKGNDINLLLSIFTYPCFLLY